MKVVLIILVVLSNFLNFINTAYAQAINMVDSRVAASRHGVSFTFLTYTREWDPWSLSVGAITYRDFGDGFQSVEGYVGGGYNFLSNDQITFGAGLYVAVAKESEPLEETLHPFYLWPIVWLEADLPRFVLEAEIVPYVPFDKSGNWGILVGHLMGLGKVSARWRLGLGYSGDKFSGEPTHHRPFLAVRRDIGEHSSLTGWLQKVPEGGIQARLNYKLEF